MITSLWELGCQVRISEDGYTATLKLDDPKGKFRYEALSLIRYVKENGVRYGLKEEMIFRMAVEEIYDEELVIAEGVRAMPGRDGEFEFYFRTNIECKPSILEDGTVDYLEKNLFELVNAGQLLARYIKATHGSNGRNVKNEKIIAYRGKELTPLQGRGFILSPNRMWYHAGISGQVSLEKDMFLNVNNICVHEGNLTPKEGNIHFDGNVIVKGSVFPGLVVEGTGEVIIDGIVDSATIRAGGRMLLREGVVGKASIIECRSNLKGKFFEAAKLVVSGDLECNYLLNCNTNVAGNINVIGKKGIILGGETYAGMHIYTSNAGSEAETKTILRVGVNEDYYKKLEKITTRKEELKKEMSELEESVKENPKLTRQVSFQVRDIVDEKNKCDDEIKKLYDYYELAQKAKIEIARYVFPGVSICINMEKIVLKQPAAKLLFTMKDKHLAVYKA